MHFVESTTGTLNSGGLDTDFSAVAALVVQTTMRYVLGMNITNELASVARTGAPFQMPTEWHGTVPNRYQGFILGSNTQRKPQPFNSFDTHMVVNTSTGIAVQSENCPGRAGQAARAMSDHNEANGHHDRYKATRIPGYLTGKDSPQNWQRLIDANN